MGGGRGLNDQPVGMDDRGLLACEYQFGMCFGDKGRKKLFLDSVGLTRTKSSHAPLMCPSKTRRESFVSDSLSLANCVFGDRPRSSSSAGLG